MNDNSQANWPFRYEYFIIWANGFHVEDKIMKILENEPRLEIVETEKIDVDDLEKFIFALYEPDSVKGDVLKEKVAHLLRDESKLRYVFLKHRQPDLISFGGKDGGEIFYRSRCYQNLKMAIRELFNRRINGKMTMENVVHASDNETQVDHILKLLGKAEGLGYLFEKYGRSTHTQNDYIDAGIHAPGCG